MLALIAAPKAFDSTEAIAVQPDWPDPPGHDRWIRRFHRIELDPATLREEICLPWSPVRDACW